MAINYYLRCEKVGGGLCFVSTIEKLPLSDKCKLVDIEDKTTKLYIKYVDCCFINKKGEVYFDAVKVLSLRLEEFKRNLDRTLSTLRQFFVEAHALNNNDVVIEITEDINDLVNCLNRDFSAIDNIEDLDNLSIPELAFDHYTHYMNKLYNV